MRPTDRNSFQKAAEAKFPIKIDIPVPPRLPEMYAWCRENVAAGQWAEHSHQVRRKGERPLDFARWYFANEADAEAFRLQWAGGGHGNV